MNMDDKRQVIIEDLLANCNDDPTFLIHLIEDYVWTFKEDLVEMLYIELEDDK